MPPSIHFLFLSPNAKHLTCIFLEPILFRTESMHCLAYYKT